METPYKFVIDTRYNFINRLIFLKEPSVDIFLEKCEFFYKQTDFFFQTKSMYFVGKEVFQIKCDSAKFRMTTNTGAPIRKDHFATVVQVAGGYFVVHLWISAIDSSVVVTPNDITEYLISMNAQSVLNERTGILTEKSRRALIRHLLDFQLLRFGPTPTLPQKESVANATAFVFENLNPVSRKFLIFPFFGVSIPLFKI